MKERRRTESSFNPVGACLRIRVVANPFKVRLIKSDRETGRPTFAQMSATNSHQGNQQLIRWPAPQRMRLANYGDSSTDRDDQKKTRVKRASRKFSANFSCLNCCDLERFLSISLAKLVKNSSELCERVSKMRLQHVALCLLWFSLFDATQARPRIHQLQSSVDAIDVSDRTQYFYFCCHFFQQDKARHIQLWHSILLVRIRRSLDAKEFSNPRCLKFRPFCYYLLEEDPVQVFPRNLLK